MNFEELSSIHNSTFKDLLQVLSETCVQIINNDLTITISDVKDLASFKDGVNEPCVKIKLNTTGKSKYEHSFYITSDFAIKINAWMLFSDPEESLTDEHIEGLGEVLNQILGQISGHYSEAPGSFSHQDLDISKIDVEEIEKYDLDAKAGLRANYEVKIGEEVFQVHHSVIAGPKLVGAAESDDSQANLKNAEQGMDQNPSDFDTSRWDDDNKVEVHPANFGSFSQTSSGNGQPRNMNLILDVDLLVTAELGRKDMQIKDVLKLGKGSIVELDKAAGEPLELFVNGTKLAEGEVVVVEEHFGIRITQLLNPEERIKSLG